MKLRVPGTAGMAMSLLSFFMAPLPAQADLELARKSGCVGCHAMDIKVVGPSWRDIAARYRDVEGAREMLIRKVQLGGGGNWAPLTGGIAMPPQAHKVPEANIIRLVDFVLDLPPSP